MDNAKLADKNAELADAIEAAGEITDGERDIIISALRRNAEYLEQAAAPADPHELTKLRRFHQMFAPVRQGRELVGVEQKQGPEDIARAWLEVDYRDASSAIVAVLDAAKAVARRWMQVTPERVEHKVPDAIVSRRYEDALELSGMSPDSIHEKTVSGEDLTSYQRALLKIPDTPPDYRAMDDERMGPLVYQLVRNIKAMG